MPVGPDNPVAHDAFAILPSDKFILEIVLLEYLETYRYAPLIAMAKGPDNPVVHDAFAIVPSDKFILEIVPAM
jgi:hypothetical protein